MNNINSNNKADNCLLGYVLVDKLLRKQITGETSRVNKFAQLIKRLNVSFTFPGPLQRSKLNAHCKLI